MPWNPFSSCMGKTARNPKVAPADTPAVAFAPPPARASAAVPAPAVVPVPGTGPHTPYPGGPELPSVAGMPFNRKPVRPINPSLDPILQASSAEFTPPPSRPPSPVPSEGSIGSSELPPQTSRTRLLYTPPDSRTPSPTPTPTPVLNKNTLWPILQTINRSGRQLFRRSNLWNCGMVSLKVAMLLEKNQLIYMKEFSKARPRKLGWLIAQYQRYCPDSKKEIIVLTDKEINLLHEANKEDNVGRGKLSREDTIKEFFRACGPNTHAIISGWGKFRYGHSLNAFVDQHGEVFIVDAYTPKRLVRSKNLGIEYLSRYSSIKMRIFKS